MLYTLLTVTWYVLCIGSIVLLAWGVWSWITGADPAALQLQIQTGGLQITVDGMHLQENFRAGFERAGLFIALPSLLLLLFIVHHLRRLLRSLTGDEHPLQSTNCQRMRSIGYAVLLWSVWSSAAQFLVAWQLTQSVGIPGVHLTAVLRPDVNMLILAAVILILAEVFRIAVTLREEQDLTI